MKGIRDIGKAFLIMAVFFLFGSGNVSAAEENTVQTLWSATMTAGKHYSPKEGRDLYGYYGGNTPAVGALTSDTFSYNGDEYKVYEIQKIGNILVLGFRSGPAVFSDAYEVLKTESIEKNRVFYLNIGNSVQLDFRDRVIPTEEEDEDYFLHESEVRRNWLNQRYNWSEGQQVSVSITTKALDGGLRLPSDGNGTSGELGIFDDPNKDGTGQWERICDDNWGDTDAEVACSQLGLSGGTATIGIRNASMTHAETFLLDEVICDGTEDRVIDCPHDGRGVHDCAAWEIAGVTCTSP